MSDVKPIPDGYHSVTPYLFVSGAAEAIDFYIRAFGATERMRMDGPRGMIMHAELQIGDSVVMLSDENVDMGALSPQAIGGTPVMLSLTVPNDDEAAARFVEAGGEVVIPIEDRPYGRRDVRLEDPFGHLWIIGHPLN